LAEAWRISIAQLSQTLIAAWRRYPTPPELSPDEDYTQDPIAAFGILEAQRHRARGITLSMFLGLMKYYQQSYLDLLRQGELDAQQIETAERFIARFFARIELGFCAEWCSLGEQEKTRELQESNRRMTNEKNKYLTILFWSPAASEKRPPSRS
jgi:hypothetical protein